MGRRYLTALIILFLAFSSLKAYAVVLDEANIKNEISAQISAKYKNIIPDAEIKTDVLAIPFAKVSLPDGKISYKISMSTDKFLPRDIAKVDILINGKVQRTFNAPVVIKVYKNVLVAACAISREMPVNNAVVDIEKREISNNLNYVLTPQYLNKDIYAKKFFNKGEIIDERFVKARPDILRNSQVVVLFNSNDLTISVDGIALSDGVVGERITVLNKTYNRVYKGVVIGENKVLVRI